MEGFNEEVNILVSLVQMSQYFQLYINLCASGEANAHTLLAGPALGKESQVEFMFLTSGI